MPSTADGTLMLTDQPSLNEPVDLSASLNDNRTGIPLGDTVDGSLLICTVGHQGDGVMDYSAPSVVWVRSGQVVDDTDSRITITLTTMVNGQVTSFLTINNSIYNITLDYLMQECTSVSSLMTVMVGRSSPQYLINWIQV